MEPARRCEGEGNDVNDGDDDVIDDVDADDHELKVPVMFACTC